VSFLIETLVFFFSCRTDVWSWFHTREMQTLCYGTWICLTVPLPLDFVSLGGLSTGKNGSLLTLVSFPLFLGTSYTITIRYTIQPSAWRTLIIHHSCFMSQHVTLILAGSETQQKMTFNRRSPGSSFFSSVGRWEWFLSLMHVNMVTLLLRP
jgi:hypothetical protein